MALLSISDMPVRIFTVVVLLVLMIPVLLMITHTAGEGEQGGDVVGSSDSFILHYPRYDKRSPTIEEWNISAVFKGSEPELVSEEERASEELQIVYRVDPASHGGGGAETGGEGGEQQQQQQQSSGTAAGGATSRKEKLIPDEDIVSYITLGDTGITVKRYETLFDYSGAPPPAFIFIHGGGWVTGTPDLSPKNFMNRIVGAVVYAINFRVNHQFPVQFNDCLRATRYILQHTQEMNIDPKKVYILGGSSGGNLAAAVTNALTKEPPGSFVPLTAQVLVNPLLQAIDFSTPSFQQNNSEFTGVTREKVIGMWTVYGWGRDLSLLKVMKSNRHVPASVVTSYRQTLLNHDKLPKSYLPPKYTSTPPGSEASTPLWERMKDTILDERFSPIMAESFDKLPPTFMYVGVRDVVRDDSEFYKMKVEAAGVRVQYVMDMDGFHGSFWLFTPKQQLLYKQIADFLETL